MALSLNTIKPARGSRKRKKRIGRGNASGHGTYSTRGMKGQRSRSGVSGLKLKGLRKTLLAIPKFRGFKSLKPKAVVFNLEILDKKFNDKEIISPKTLHAKGLIGKSDFRIKILGNGEIKKILTVKDCEVSASAKEKIEKAGGQIVSK